MDPDESDSWGRVVETSMGVCSYCKRHWSTGYQLPRGREDTPLQKPNTLYDGYMGQQMFGDAAESVGDFMPETHLCTFQTIRS